MLHWWAYIFTICKSSSCARKAPCHFLTCWLHSAFLSQFHGLPLFIKGGLELKVWHVHLEHVAVNLQYQVLRAVPVKQVIINVKKLNKPEGFKNLFGIAKWMILYILKKKEFTGKSQHKTCKTKENNCGGWQDNFLLEKTIHNRWSDQECPQGVGISVSKSIKQRINQSKYRGYTTRCKPLVSLINSRTRKEFAK